MKELVIILSCTWKFALTFPVAVYAMQMSFKETLIYTNLGGILGVLFFTFLSGIFIKGWNKYIRPGLEIGRRRRPVFTKRRRRFIQIKNKYGFIGIVILNPIVISIPISTFLVAKYYGKNKMNLVWLIAGQFGWSLIYTYFYVYIKQTI